jgi:solute:Na+ symporter, SSS family
VTVTFLVYFLLLGWSVLRILRKPAEGEIDYIVAGRKLTLPAFIATMVSSWYGGILGVGEYSWNYGVSNWLVFGVPYYLYAIIFALFIAKRARKSEILTLPQKLAERFGNTVGKIGATMIFIMTVPAAYVLMLGVLSHWILGWPLWLGVVVGTVFSVAYVFRGGLNAVVATDKIQFLLMFLGFLILVPACIYKYGGWDFLVAELPKSHLQWDGGLGFQAVAVWYVIAASTLVEPVFYQRCFAASNEAIAKKGLLISVGFWLVFDFLTTTAGLYARAVLPDLESPIAAFPELASITLSPLFAGLFLAGLLATIMSTVDSHAFIAAITFGQDLSGNSHSLKRVQIGLVVVAILAIGMALWSESVITLWHHLGSVGTPVLLIPVVLSFTTINISGRFIATSMITSGLVALLWLAIGPDNIEAIFPGLLCSALITGIGICLKR